MLLDTLHPPQPQGHCTSLPNGGPSDVRLNMNFELPQKLFHGDVREQQEASYSEEHFIRHMVDVQVGRLTHTSNDECDMVQPRVMASRRIDVGVYIIVFLATCTESKTPMSASGHCVEYLVGMAMAMSWRSCMT